MKSVVKEKDSTIHAVIERIGVLLARYFLFFVVALCALVFTLGYLFFIKHPLEYVRSQAEQALQQEITDQERRRDSLREELKKLQDQPKEILYAAVPMQSESASLFAQMEKLFQELGVEVRSMNITEEQAVRQVQISSTQPAGVGDEIGNTPPVASNQEQPVSPSVSPASGGSSQQMGDPRLRDVRTITMDLELTGTDYDGFKKILQRIENFERITQVESAQYNNNDVGDTEKEQKSENAQSEVSSAFSLSLVTYYLPEL